MSERNENVELLQAEEKKELGEEEGDLQVNDVQRKDFLHDKKKLVCYFSLLFIKTDSSFEYNRDLVF